MKLIYGQFQNGYKAWWENPFEYDLRPGNYAVVENLKDYNLVKILGQMETDKEFAKQITDKHKLKKVVLSVPKFLLSGEYESKHLTEEEVKEIQYKPTSYMEKLSEE